MGWSYLSSTFIVYNEKLVVRVKKKKKEYFEKINKYGRNVFFVIIMDFIFYFCSCLLFISNNSVIN